MENIEILKLKDRHRIIKEHNFNTMAEVEAYRKAIDDYKSKQLTITDVSQRSELLQKIESVKNFEWGINPVDNENRMCELIKLL